MEIRDLLIISNQFLAEYKLILYFIRQGIHILFILQHEIHQKWEKKRRDVNRK